MPWKVFFIHPACMIARSAWALCKIFVLLVRPVLCQEDARRPDLRICGFLAFFIAFGLFIDPAVRKINSFLIAGLISLALPLSISFFLATVIAVGIAAVVPVAISFAVSFFILLLGKLPDGLCKLLKTIVRLCGTLFVSNSARYQCFSITDRSKRILNPFLQIRHIFMQRLVLFFQII